MATAAVEIVVPDGLGAGDEFTVEWGGTSYTIAVPAGVAAGQALTIELPAPGDADAAQATQAVEIVVPDGLGAGDEFTEWGGTSYITPCPPAWPRTGADHRAARARGDGVIRRDGRRAPTRRAPWPCPPMKSRACLRSSATGAVMTDIDAAIERMEQTFAALPLAPLLLSSSHARGRCPLSPQV